MTLARRVRSSVRRHDLIVLGGGTGGLVSALIAAGIGARVALIERERIGGECLWSGCVPSKSLIAAAGLAHRMRHADRVGLRPVAPEIDFASVMDHVHRAIATIQPQDSPERLRAAGVEVIAGSGAFTAPGRICVGPRQLRFRAAIIATGATPALPAIPGLRDVEPLTSDTVWEQRQLPETLIVLGGGPIGCELGQAFARLGSHVTLIEFCERLLPREEPLASRLIAQRLRAEGVDVLVGHRALELRDGRELIVQGPGGSRALPFERILIAAGRAPRSAGLGLDSVGVRTQSGGAIAVDSHLRTSAPGVFAVGDVTALLPFTHVAAHHARIATPNALFHARRTVSGVLPWVTFTDPEVARVGLTEAQARARWGGRVVVARSDYRTLDRAITAGEAYGFAQLIAGPGRRLVGATIAAPGAGEAIAELTAWIARGEKIDAVSQTVHAYPTLAEGPARAADGLVSARYSRPRLRALARPVLAALRTARL